MCGEEGELRAQGDANPVQGAFAPDREVGQGSLQLGCATGQHRGEQTALRVEIVKQQLLVDARPPRNLLYTRAVKPAPRELFAGRGDDS